MKTTSKILKHEDDLQKLKNEDNFIKNKEDLNKQVQICSDGCEGSHSSVYKIFLLEMS